MAVTKKSAKKTAKKAAKKKVVAAKTTSRQRAIADKQTKTQIVTALSEETGLARKEVAAVFTSLSNLITRHVQKRGSGEFTIPECGIKVRRVMKPRTKARMGRNPATGEEIKIPAKPAKTVIKLTALKALKDKLG
ncbi:MAG: HU family DNA-binding protein [Chromatiales bacterium]|jgi:nucleoid DNA-binding protein